jgi:hypothetical protein
MKKYERYFAFDSKTEPLFGKFSAHSLSARHDTIETYLRNGRPKDGLLGEAQNHIENTIRYLQTAVSQWDSNIVGGTVEEVHDVCLAAAHYAHSRLRPAFTAASLAGHDCYQDYAGYLAIEDRYLQKLFALKNCWDSPASRVRLWIGSPATNADDELIDAYRTALTEFATDLVAHLDSILADLKAVS